MPGRRKADPNGPRSRAARSRNLAPCPFCRRYRQGCRGGYPCERCVQAGRVEQCIPENMNQRSSTVGELHFVHESGLRSPPGRRATVSAGHVSVAYPPPTGTLTISNGAEADQNESQVQGSSSIQCINEVDLRTICDSMADLGLTQCTSPTSDDLHQDFGMLHSPCSEAVMPDGFQAQYDRSGGQFTPRESHQTAYLYEQRVPTEPIQSFPWNKSLPSNSQRSNSLPIRPQEDEQPSGEYVISGSSSDAWRSASGASESGAVTILDGAAVSGGNGSGLTRLSSDMQLPNTLHNQVQPLGEQSGQWIVTGGAVDSQEPTAIDTCNATFDGAILSMITGMNQGYGPSLSSDATLSYLDQLRETQPQLPQQFDSIEDVVRLCENMPLEIIEEELNRLQGMLGVLY